MTTRPPPSNTDPYPSASRGSPPIFMRMSESHRCHAVFGDDTTLHFEPQTPNDAPTLRSFLFAVVENPIVGLLRGAPRILLSITALATNCGDAPLSVTQPSPPRLLSLFVILR